MKRRMINLAVLSTLALALTLTACSNNGGQTGVQDDGIKAVDANGALPEGAGQYHNTKDSTGMEKRVDTQIRDSSNLQQ
jgi:hypothetical protein